MGLEALMSWGPEKMLIRCHKESQHPTVDPKTSGWASKRTRKTQRDSHNSGVKIWSLCSLSSTLSHANLEQPFRTLAIKWEVNIIVKKSSCVFLPASFIPASLSLCRCELFYIYMCMYADVNLHMWLYNNLHEHLQERDCFLSFFVSKITWGVVVGV